MFGLFKAPDLRNKILFTLFILLVFRLLAHIPAPGVNVAALRELLQKNAVLGLFNLFSGGGFQNFSIVTLSLAPYINASIIMQLLTMMVPSLEALSKEGESGREQINQYTKYLTVPLSFMQAYGVYFLLSTQQGIVQRLDVLSLLALVFTLTGGSLFLTWIGDLVTERGVGNGISLLIFVGIISNLPSSALNFIYTINPENFFNAVSFLAVTLLVIVGVVLVNEGERNIPLEYGRRGYGSQTVTNYLPIKINQAGVIPIIFAISVVLAPSFLSGPLSQSGVQILKQIGDFLVVNFSSQSPTFNVAYFLLVFFFTYFYTSVQFSPQKIADDVKKRGGFIPGIRPGLATQKYLSFIVSRITLIGALFLGIVAILPYLVQSGIQISTVAVGGTSLLIVVSVVLETIRQVESMMVTRNYEKFLT